MTAAPLFCAAADPPISAAAANNSQSRFAIVSSRVDLLTLYGLGRGVRPCTRPWGPVCRKAPQKARARHPEGCLARSHFSVFYATRRHLPRRRRPGPARRHGSDDPLEIGVRAGLPWIGTWVVTSSLSRRMLL